MDTADFLSAVVPEGRIVIARMVDRQKPDGTPYKGFMHIVCSSHAEAAETAHELTTGGHNVYFALASYKQGFFENAKGKRVVRVRENVRDLKALWFDIDFKDGYPEAKDAAAALRTFCKATQMPVPAILVGSGNGLHAYWPFTEALPVDRWQKLAESLKEAARTNGLKADLACSADSCRVLRPPGTSNFKDPSNPKPVKILYSSGELYDPATLEGVLTPWAPSRKAPKAESLNSELTGGVSAPVKPSRFEEIVRHCPVTKAILESEGKDCNEPEWVAILQLLKHCEDGPLYYHAVSKGHPGYTESATEHKWAQRLANTAGPTLCKTFEQYRPEICSRCPHNGFIKSPTQVGYEGMQDVTGLPTGWRVAPDEKGVERLMLTDPTAGVKEWLKMFRHIPSNFRPVRSIITGQFDMMLDIKLKGTQSWTVTIPMSMLGNARKLVETLAGFGVVLKTKEIAPFGDLMASWLEKLQNARRVADVTEQLGWVMEESKIVGFGTGPAVYYADGRIRNDIRPSKEFATLAKLYEPRGELTEWRKVADFITTQNNYSLTAVLAASFGAPLLKFVGIQGGILSLVSTASGVGKSSILKLSQAVWGSPIHAMNSVDDTPKSVAKKMGYLNNLPAYWDELRGKQTVDGFCNLAFQMTQGREKSRLSSAAVLQEGQRWETMMVVASNESIFEAMARRTTGSDAGMVRTFEIEMTDTPETDKTSPEVTLLFETLGANYGHAGRIYAQYLASNSAEVEKLTKDTYLALAGTMESAERFWYGIITILLVGASLANRLDLAKIDVKGLRKYLLTNVAKLKRRTNSMAEEASLPEILGDYLRERGDRTLVIDKFQMAIPTGPLAKPNSTERRGRPPGGYIPEIKDTPKSERASVVIAMDQKLVRFATKDFINWLQSRELPSYGVLDQMVDTFGATKVRCVMGLGTKYAGPRIWAVELDLSKAGFSNRGGSPDSSPDSAPEGSS